MSASTPEAALKPEVTSHEKPTFIKNNVVHYCVPILLRVTKTASLGISNILSPLMQIAEDGGLESAIRCDIGLKVAFIMVS
jgi:alanine dehydrogenase